MTNPTNPTPPRPTEPPKAAPPAAPVKAAPPAKVSETEEKRVGETLVGASGDEINPEEDRFYYGTVTKYVDGKKVFTDHLTTDDVIGYEA